MINKKIINKTTEYYGVSYKQRPQHRQIDQLTNKPETVNIRAEQKILEVKILIKKINKII